MFPSNTRRFRLFCLWAVVSLTPCAGSAAVTDLSNSPLASSATSEVKPNILFVLDDSGSMNWKFMPDALETREDRVGFRNNQCNLVYYNPGTRYVVPKTSTGGDVNSAMPTAFTAAYDDGFGAYYGYETRTSADSGATWSAWTTAASCTEDTTGTSRRQCRVSLLPSAGTSTDLSTSFRAFVDGTIDSNSRTNKIDTAQAAYYWRYRGSTTLVPLAGDCDRSISPSYTVNNASWAAGSPSLATYTTSAAHNFVVGDTVAIIDIKPSGYRTTGVVQTVPTTTTFTVAVASNPGAYTNSGTAWNATRYQAVKEICTDGTPTTSTCTALGKTVLWEKVIVGLTSGPGTVDINGDGVLDSTDQDERQNFANWYSYYSKRIQMMKSAAGRAFVGMTDSKRVGFITINPGSPVSGSKFKTIANFDLAQKQLWFDTLYSTTVGDSTPLREALSRAGRYYAAKTDGINSGMDGDPVQYSCQQNFTILTTDGYWNGPGGKKLDGTTDMDNQDGVIFELDNYRPSGKKYAMSPRPIYDGASTTYNWYTATLDYQTAPCTLPGQRQQRTRQYQKCSSPAPALQTRTSTDHGATWSAWSTNPSPTCESVTAKVAGSGFRRQCQNGVVTATRRTTLASGNSDNPTWTAWTATGTCTDDSSTASRRECRSTALYSSCAGTWSDSQCTTDPTTTFCRSSVDAWANVASCIPAAQNASGVEIECQTIFPVGTKLQYQSKAYVTNYAGPGASGTPLVAKTLYETGDWTDADPATCDAAPPAVPVTADVTGAGPPTPPVGCTGWPCELLAAGTGGLVADISSANFTGTDPITDPFKATYTTSATHKFLVGHSVTIAGSSRAAYNGVFAITAVSLDSTQFTVDLPGNPGGTATGGTATLYAGSSNSLADVAQYYYKTDLRTDALGNCTGALGPSTSVCSNDVYTSGDGIEDDRANWQHMTTFTMGLGLTGTVAYSPAYKTEGCVAQPISGATWASSVATVTTSVAHGFPVNRTVIISGGLAGYRGSFRILAVPSATTFTYALATNPAGAFGTGTATGCPDFNRIRSGTINWPVPVADNATALDDLWHAAVNGRGQYFGASNPDTVVSALDSALKKIAARLGSGSAAATSNLEPVAGDNFAYTAKYKTLEWTGDLEAKEIDLTTGAVSGTPVWSAQARLDALTKSACDNRNIKLFRSGATNNLVDFKWNTYACDAGGAPTGAAVTTLSAAEQANFDASKVALLSHYPNLANGTPPLLNQRTGSDGTNGAAGFNLVNYLRGQRGKEGFSSGPPATNTDPVLHANKLYRTREHVLGDIVNAQPVFVKAPFAEYDDAGYVGFKLAQAARTPMVYSAANDGMLHAFFSGTSIVDPAGGKEAWAFIPSIVLPNMYKTASENYAAEHAYSVDGTPSVGDVLDPSPLDPVTGLPTTPMWKTILVAGFNKGGKGYYALDISDPATPRALWEFKHDPANCVTVNATTKAPADDEYSDCHLGYSFNNPIITKLRDGRWVAIVTSGYNNVNSPTAAGDGLGYLYVLEAMTGKILYKISTGVGSSIDPSGLNHISGWVDNALRNNQSERIYGVDLKGNIWRFDINDSLNAAGREATLVATAVDPSGVAQPITTRPELAEVGGAAVVYVATGRYLGASDLGDTQTQSIWAVRDTLAATPLINLRTTLRKIVTTNHGEGSSAFRTNGCTAQCDSVDGWFTDLPDTRERVNVDMKLQLGTLVVASNVPDSSACNPAGYSWLNYLNSSNGDPVAHSADGAVGRRLVGAEGKPSLAVGLNVLRLPGGKIVVIVTTSDAEPLTTEPPFDVAPPTGKRVSWRELTQ